MNFADKDNKKHEHGMKTLQRANLFAPVLG